MRSSWDETWMNVAIAVSQRSACSNRQVGAIIVTKTNRPVSTGYNGPPANFQIADLFSSCSSYCPRGRGDVERGTSYSGCVSVHAEANALLFADRNDYVGGTIYVTNPCCWDCAKLVSNSGLSRVVVGVSSKDSHADVDGPIGFLQSCKIQVDKVER